jgi:hypothetical protein
MDGQYWCTNISGCCDDNTDQYVCSFGWKEVDISEVPSGTPLVDGRIQTYKLMFY